MKISCLWSVVFTCTVWLSATRSIAAPVYYDSEVNFLDDLSAMGITPAIDVMDGATISNNVITRADFEITFDTGFEGITEDYFGLGQDGIGIGADADGSVDLYLQNENPGPEKQSNWLPAPTGKFIPMLRLYWPKETPPSIIDGTWKILAVQNVI